MLCSTWNNKQKELLDLSNKELAKLEHEIRRQKQTVLIDTLALSSDTTSQQA